MTDMSAIPPVDRTLWPADIQKASTKVQSQYQAGLMFEQQLTSELAKQLTDGDSSLSDSPYASLLPDALSDAITQSGGLGIARSLVDLPETSK